MAAEDVGKEIRLERILVHGMTLSALSEASGVAKGNLSEIENGKKSPTVKTLRKIAKGLGIHPGDLL